MVADFGTFRRLPWRPRVRTVYCFYYDLDIGELCDLDPRGNGRAARADVSRGGRREHVRRHRAGVHVAATQGVRRARAHDRRPWRSTRSPTSRSSSRSCSTCSSTAAGWGCRITHADAEDKSQVEVNQAPNSPLAYADDFFTYRQICRIVARKHGLIATFMPKPFMGYSANGHHHNLSLMSDDGRERPRRRPQGRLPPQRAGRGLPRRPARARGRADARRRAHGQLVQALLGRRHSGRRSTSRTASTTARACSGSRTSSAHRGAGDGRLLQPLPDVARASSRASTASAAGSIPASRSRKHHAGHQRPPRGADPHHADEAIDAFKADDLMREVFRPGLYETFVGIRQDELDRFWSQVSPWELEFYLERWP